MVQYKYSIQVQEWDSALAGNVDEVEHRKTQIVDKKRRKYLQEDGIDSVLDDLVAQTRE